MALFRFIWNKTEFHSVPDQSKSANTVQIWFNLKRFLNRFCGVKMHRFLRYTQVSAILISITKIRVTSLPTDVHTDTH